MKKLTLATLTTFALLAGSYRAEAGCKPCGDRKFCCNEDACQKCGEESLLRPRKQDSVGTSRVNDRRAFPPKCAEAKAKN